MPSRIPAGAMSIVNEFLDLIPGTRVTQRRLATILDWVKNTDLTLDGGTAAEPTHVVVLSAQTGDSDDEDDEELVLLLLVKMPHIHAVTGNSTRNGPILLARQFAFTSDGVLRALVLAKATIADAKARGVCPTCEARGEYRLKAATMPLCVPCVFNAFFA